jgi:hypothetical protein
MVELQTNFEDEAEEYEGGCRGAGCVGTGSKRRAKNVEKMIERHTRSCSIHEEYH